MWALVEDNTITKIINNPRGMVIGDTRHSKIYFLLDGLTKKEKLSDFMKL